MRLPPEREESMEIPLTSLLDAMFILIIFFVVTTTMKKVHRELPIELPPATVSEKRLNTTEILVVAVDREGNRFLNGEPVGAGVMLERLAEAARDPETRVRIDADRETPYHQVVEVIEAVRFHGLNQVGFRTRDERGGR